MCFCFSLLISCLMGNKPNYSQSESFLSVMAIGKWSPWLHLKLWGFLFFSFSCFFFLYCLWLLYSQVIYTCEEALFSWKRLNNCLLIWRSKWISLICLHIQLLLYLIKSLSTHSLSFLTFALLIFFPVPLLGTGMLCTSIKPVLV